MDDDRPGRNGEDARWSLDGPSGEASGIQLADVDSREPEDTDEAAASIARRRARTHGPEPIEPDDRIGAILRAGERALAVRRGAAFIRRDGRARMSDGVPAFGDLYVTTQRVIHIGPSLVAIDLDEIEDAAIAGEQVLLLLRDGQDAVIGVDRPRLLRVQISTARAARTGAGGA